MEAKVTPEIAKRKAELLAGGPVRVEKDFRFPFPVSRSTAGPGAGSTAVVFAFGNTRAKKAVSRESGEFLLVQDEDTLTIERDGRPFLKGVELLPTLYHAPFQAFINIESACIMDCKFCSSAKLDPSITKNLTDEKIIEMVKDASKREDFQSVSFTSAVTHSPKMTVDRMARLVAEVRRLLPDAPIGVEPYATRPDEIDALRKAGADEIKQNIETFDRDIFEKICPNRDFDIIMHSLMHASSVFGSNRVSSNIIYGLGETDENVIEGTKVLANFGAVANLRALRRNEYNVAELEKALGRLEPVTAERMLRLAKEQKKVFREYSVNPLKFMTMCNACLSCDLVPFWDI